MKRSSDHHPPESPHKIPKRERKTLRRNREDFEALDKEALIDKIVATTSELDEINKVINTAKRREALWRQKASEKEKEIKELIKERDKAYYSGISHGPAQRDQHIDPSLYEAFISMKDKLMAKDKIIAENQELINALSQDQQQDKMVMQFLKGRYTFVKRLREDEKTLQAIATLENNLALAQAALRALRQEKKDYKSEMAERDAKISDLCAELHHLRGMVSEESGSNKSMDAKEEAPAVVEQPAYEKPVIGLSACANDADHPEESKGIEVDLSVLHGATNDHEQKFSRSSSEERCVSVEDNGSLKITV
ncbi:unnamed protein product [Cylicocyclus nassatus]|uniref:Uncharacterized protein n=1 Tax=Cylicocyclus nassatus TaxID=53992 RepID=A0AA36GNX9_CYLNA|nr:unnamed protein product [Cylicocyclus nassatus]